MIFLLMAVLGLEGEAREKDQTQQARILSIVSDDIVKFLEFSRGTLKRKTVDSEDGQTFTLYFGKAGLFERAGKVFVEIRGIERKGSSASASVAYVAGPLDGAALRYVLKKKGGTWIVLRRVLMQVSWSGNVMMW